MFYTFKIASHTSARGRHVQAWIHGPTSKLPPAKVQLHVHISFSGHTCFSKTSLHLMNRLEVNLVRLSSWTKVYTVMCRDATSHPQQLLSTHFMIRVATRILPPTYAATNKNPGPRGVSRTDPTYEPPGALPSPWFSTASVRTAPRSASRTQPQQSRLSL